MKNRRIDWAGFIMLCLVMGFLFWVAYVLKLKSSNLMTFIFAVFTLLFFLYDRWVEKDPPISKIATSLDKIASSLTQHEKSCAIPPKCEAHENLRNQINDMDKKLNKIIEQLEKRSTPAE